MSGVADPTPCAFSPGSQGLDWLVNTITGGK